MYQKEEKFNNLHFAGPLSLFYK